MIGGANGGMSPLLTAVAIPALICTAETVQRCDGPACKPVPSTMHLELEPERGLYAHCSGNGCVVLSDAVTTKGNGYVTIASAQRAVTIEWQSMRFVEMSTAGLTVTLSHGTCRQNPER